MSRYLVFDVNETMLDVAALDPLFERWFGEAQTRKEWFLTLQENWLTATIIDQYQPFGELVKAALVMVGDRRGITVDDEDQTRLVENIMNLPAHEDVPEALQMLQDKGFSLTALTNSTLKAAQQQLSSAGLTDYFDGIMSVDEVKRYKPAPEPYRMAAERLGIATRDITMIAAHAWDISGAAAAGCRTAFVRRPGKVPNPAGVKADLDGDGLLDLARQLIG